MPAVALVTAAILLLITGTLAISDLGTLKDGSLAEAAPSVSPAAPLDQAHGPFVAPGPTPTRISARGTQPPTAAPDQALPYTCEDREIRDATTSRWQLRTVLAGARRGFERVTFELTRLGRANRAARIAIEWMSPEEARGTFGLPRFDGQRGLLLTFAGPVTTPSAQLIGPVDLRGGGMDSISGVYRFIDREGLVRTSSPSGTKPVLGSVRRSSRSGTAPPAARPSSWTLRPRRLLVDGPAVSTDVGGASIPRSRRKRYAVHAG
jgi:hypothetical protein